MIPVASLDEALPSGPLRRNRRRAHKESRAAGMSGKKEGDAASRRAARVSKQNNSGNAKKGEMLKGFRVIVSGLQPTTTEAQVRSLFRAVGGRILKCTMGRQAGTNKPVGVAEVVYETAAQADKAARTLNKASVDGRVISVQSRGLAFFTKGANAKTGKKGRSGGRGSGKSGAAPKKEKKKPETMESLNAALQAYMG